MSLMIKYDAVCFYCKNKIKKGHGFLHRANGKWFAHCNDCFKKNKENRKHIVKSSR